MQAYNVPPRAYWILGVPFGRCLSVGSRLRFSTSKAALASLELELELELELGHSRPIGRDWVWGRFGNVVIII